MNLSASRSRTLAIALLALVTVTVGLIVFGPVLVLHQSQAAEIETGSRELATYRRMAAGQAQFEQQLATLNRTQRLDGLPRQRHIRRHWRRPICKST